MRAHLSALALLAFVSPAAAQYLPVGVDNGATSQVSVLTASTPIVAARTGGPRTGRVAVTIENLTGTGLLCVGFTSGVTTGGGFCLPAVVGASITLNTTAAIWGIATVGAQTVSVVETF